MARRGDNSRARSVKVTFDDNFSATSYGGAALFEKVIRRLGIRSLLNRHVPERNGDYSSADVCEQVIEGLLCGGKGFQAAELLRQKPGLAQIFGHKQVAEEATVWRALCDIAGLPQRKFEDVYMPVGPELVSLDVFGQDRRPRVHRRLVGEKPEGMLPEHREQMNELLRSVALRLGSCLRADDLLLWGFLPNHGDGTDLEVRGRCFDAASKNRHGDQVLRLMTLSVGPLYASQALLKGDSDEGLALPSLLDSAAAVVESLRGSRQVLGLYDAAFAEKQVVEKLLAHKWHYIICANQYRELLERLAKQLLEHEWAPTGADASRGWAESAVAVFGHQPEGWTKVQTVVVRRWRQTDELPGVWHYSFLYTDLCSQDLPKKRIKAHGFASCLWMLYSTKQGRENYYKTLLSDLGLHHPPSGRLGASEAFGFLCAIATNLHAVMALRVVSQADRGIRLWRLVRDYVLVAGRVVMSAGKVLLVRLAGAGVEKSFKQRWLEAYASAGRL